MSINDSAVTRRGFATAIGTGVCGSGFLFTSGTARASPTLDLDWTASGDQITTTDGSLDGIRFGNGGDDALTIAYAGLTKSDPKVDIAVAIKGRSDGDEVGWAGGAETAWQTLATDSYRLTGIGGEATVGWADVFGAETPIDVTTHAGIDIGDFQVDAGEDSRTRELAVELRASIGSEGVSDSATATAAVTVTAADGDVRVSVVGSNSPVAAGEPLVVTAELENRGTTATEQMIELSIEGTQRDQLSVALDADETTSVELTWETTEEDAGDYQVVVASENEQDQMTVTVEAGTGGAVEYVVGSGRALGDRSTIGFDIENVGDATAQLTAIGVDSSSKGDYVEAAGPEHTVRSPDTGGHYGGRIDVGGASASLQSPIELPPGSTRTIELGEFRRDNNDKTVKMHNESIAIAATFDDGSTISFSVES